MQYCTLSNYSHNNNLFSMGKNKDEIEIFLSTDFKITSKWFYENFMVLNPEKYNFIYTCQKIDDSETLNLNDLGIKILNKWEL